MIIVEYTEPMPEVGRVNDKWTRMPIDQSNLQQNISGNGPSACNIRQAGNSWSLDFALNARTVAALCAAKPFGAALRDWVLQARPARLARSGSAPLFPGGVVVAANTIAIHVVVVVVVGVAVAVAVIVEVVVVVVVVVP